VINIKCLFANQMTSIYLPYTYSYYNQHWIVVYYIQTLFSITETVGIFKSRNVSHFIKLYCLKRQFEIFFEQLISYDSRHRVLVPILLEKYRLKKKSKIVLNSLTERCLILDLTTTLLQLELM